MVALSQSERFRLAAGKGQLNVIKELLNKCVISEPDKVCHKFKNDVCKTKIYVCVYI